MNEKSDKSKKESTLETINPLNFSFKNFFGKNEKINKNTKKSIDSFDLNSSAKKETYNVLDKENRFLDKKLEEQRLEKIKAKILGYEVANSKKTISKKRNLSIDHWLSKIDYSPNEDDLKNKENKENKNFDNNFYNTKYSNNEFIDNEYSNKEEYKTVEVPSIKDYQQELNLKEFYNLTQEKTLEREIIQKENNPEVNNLQKLSLPPMDYLTDSKTLNNIEIEDMFFLNINNSRIITDKINELFLKSNINAKIIQFYVNGFFTLYKIEINDELNLSNLKELLEKIKTIIEKDKFLFFEFANDNKTIYFESINKYKQIVYLKETFEIYITKNKTKKNLPIIIGKDAFLKPIIFDLWDVGSILVLGKNSTGKTSFVYNILVSILMNFNWFEVKILLIDSKNDLSIFDKTPHLVTSIINDFNVGLTTLNKVDALIEDRYEKFNKQKVNNINDYNKSAKNKLPSFVIIIDELSESMNFTRINIEDKLLKIIKKGKRVGVFLIITTKNINLITDEIKNNISTKLLFSYDNLDKINSDFSSRKFLNYGDGVFKIFENTLLHSQIGYISRANIKRIVEFVIENKKSTNNNNLNNDLISNDDKENIELLDLTDDLIVETTRFLCYRRVFDFQQIKNHLNISIDVLKKIFYTLSEYDFFDEDAFGNKILSEKIFGDVCELSKSK